MINGETAQQKCRNGIWRMFCDDVRCTAAVDCSHGQAGVGDDLILSRRNDPCGRGVAATVLARIATEPNIKCGFAGVKAAAMMTGRVQQLWPVEVSQPSGSRVGVEVRWRVAR